MIFGSNLRNVALLNYTCILIVISSFLLPIEYNGSNFLLSVIIFYILNVIGVYCTMHRYYSHKAFTFNYKVFEIVFTIIAILAGRGSVIGWVYIHRLHHHHSDSNEDPHSPKKIGYNLLTFNHIKAIENDFKIFYVRDLTTKFQIFIHKNYLLILLSFIAILSLDLELLYFGYILPLSMVHISQSVFNYFGHKSGYRNFNTDDNSHNNWFIFLLVLGESWHNNHHANPKKQSTSYKWYEFDPVFWLIKLIGK